VFGWLADIGKVEASEMLRAFNCGIGMAVFVAADEVAQAMQALGENGLAPVRLGEIIENGGERVAFRGRLKL
jgi:phosphoribosylformylglycinamidine cyclo-ligase